MKFIFLGYMASGKSTIGRLFAQKRQLNFIDLDAYIEEKEGISVTEIFKTKGEIYFRKQENLYLKELLSKEEEFVLALGGGTPCYANNMNVILESSDTISIYLKLKISTLFNRLSKEKSQRPLVADLEDNDIMEFIAKHLFERGYYYNQANVIVNGDDKEVTDLVTEINRLLS
ncbi:shikimate kinase [uncultured Tenacibaculum sp.]|uniref:shikimate kinase n=1 Tax=uncultured Tenacibaculum sp. TaxID=174713 RepID=UPI002615579A|nr:shikimate kinase [uncultured Tenacibaculum sp.]